MAVRTSRSIPPPQPPPPGRRLIKLTGTLAATVVLILSFSHAASAAPNNGSFDKLLALNPGLSAAEIRTSMKEAAAASGLTYSQAITTALEEAKRHTVWPTEWRHGCICPVKPWWPLHDRVPWHGPVCRRYLFRRVLHVRHLPRARGDLLFHDTGHRGSNI